MGIFAAGIWTIVTADVVSRNLHGSHGLTVAKCIRHKTDRKKTEELATDLQKWARSLRGKTWQGKVSSRSIRRPRSSAKAADRAKFLQLARYRRRVVKIRFKNSRIRIAMRISTKIERLVTSETSYPSQNFITIRRWLLESLTRPPYPAIVKIPVKFLYPHSDPDPDRHQNLIVCCKSHTPLLQNFS